MKIVAIPNYQTIMLPFLKLASDGEEHRFSQAVEELADEFNLSTEERNELLPSGSQAVFNNRVGWARSYLKQAGLLVSPKRGYFTITQKGMELLNTNPGKIDISVLERYSEFIEFKNRRKEKSKNDAQVEMSIEPESTLTPEDALASAYKQLRMALESEILANVKESSPSFFERLVVDLLVKMGYGGNRQDAGKALGKSGDGGIDGIINEDQLGLDVIYIQAKRWEGSVGRPEIQKFAGALQGQRARKGVFITTSSFTKEATSEGMSYFISYKSSGGKSYEEFLTELEQRGNKPGRAQSDRDSFHYLFSVFYEIIHTILCLYQKVSYEILYEDVFKWFNKLNNMLSEKETWVFTLNHDIYLECLALDCDIPITYGDTGSIRFPKSNVEMSDIVTFTCRGRDQLDISSPGFINGHKGINLVKLHGGLSELKYSDSKVICNLPLNLNNSIDLISSFNSIDEMSYYHKNKKIPSGKEMVITNLEGELDIISKSMLTGGKKYSTTNKPKSGEEKLILMENALMELDELTIIGYGFGDKHVNFRLSNSMLLNPSMSVRIVDPTSNKTPECLEQFDYDQRVKKANCGAPHWIDYCQSEKWDNDMIESLKGNSDKRYMVQVEVERRLHAGKLDG